MRPTALVLFALAFCAAASAAPPQKLYLWADGPVSHWPQIFVDWIKVP